MANHTLPEFDNRAFTCPRCGAFANQEWYLALAIDKVRAERVGVVQHRGDMDEFAFPKCVHCNQVAIWNRHFQIFS